MKKSDMIVCLSYLFGAYPSSKQHEEDILQVYWRHYGWMDREIFSEIVQRHVERQGNKWFPSIQDMDITIWEMRLYMSLSLRDPRNAFIENQEKLNRKLNHARWFLAGTERRKELT